MSTESYPIPEKYLLMRDAGSSPQQVYQALKTDEVGRIDCYRILRQLFQFSMPEAKEVMVIVDEGVSSLAEYEERFIPVFEALVEMLEREDAELDDMNAPGEADGP